MALNINLSSVTISVKNMADMVNFYNNMLGAGLSPFEAYNSTLYRGNIDGLNIVFCPVVVSGVISSHNTLQLNFLTDNIAETINLALKSGGYQKGDIVPSNNKMIVVITDPDGNTLEFLQSLDPNPELNSTNRRVEPVLSRQEIETEVNREEDLIIPANSDLVLEENIRQ